jgi:lipid II:glycine glycyltransferase (peptidoglycan interpeptide bridge formation enzyme)
LSWRGYEIYQNDKFAEIQAKHRNMKIIEIDGNKSYLLKAPIFSAIKLRTYLYDTDDPALFLEHAFDNCKRTGIPILEIFTHYDLGEIFKTDYSDLDVERRYTATYIVDLTLSEDELWMNMSKVSRQNIKKARKSNIEVSETRDIADFDGWWETYLETGERGKFVKQSYNMVKEVLETEEISRLFVARYEGKIVAGAFVLLDRVPSWWLGGSLPDYWKHSPNNLLLWDVIRWSAENGYKQFDFGGAAREEEKHGPSEFKRKFGGEFREGNQYIINLKPFKSKMIDKMIKLRYKVSKKH